MCSAERRANLDSDLYAEGGKKYASWHQHGSTVSLKKKNVGFTGITLVVPESANDSLK
jgi:hypothetical protein